MRQRFSAEQWGRWFEEFRHGGMTVAEFCRRKGVCSNSFYQWRRKLGAAATATDRAPFVPVTIAHQPLVEIELPCGATVRVANESSSLRPVLDVLMQLKAGEE